MVVKYFKIYHVEDTENEQTNKLMGGQFPLSPP